MVIFFNMTCLFAGNGLFVLRMARAPVVSLNFLGLEVRKKVFFFFSDLKFTPSFNKCFHSHVN